MLVLSFSNFVLKESYSLCLVTLEIHNPQADECQENTLGNTVLHVHFTVMSCVSRAGHCQRLQTGSNEPSSLTCFSLHIKSHEAEDHRIIWKINLFRFLLTLKNSSFPI